MSHTSFVNHTPMNVQHVGGRGGTINAAPIVAMCRPLFCCNMLMPVCWQQHLAMHAAQPAKQQQQQEVAAGVGLATACGLAVSLPACCTTCCTT